MPTPNFNLPYMVGTDPMKPSVYFNGLANTLDMNLKTGLDNSGTGFSGTEAQRAALTAPKLRNGITWYATDTRRTWLRDNGAWVVTPRLLGYSHVQPGSEQILPAAETTLSGLSLTGMPTGSPVILKVTIQAANGQSGGTRWISVQAVNGSSNAGPQRKYILPLMSGVTAGVTISHFVPVDAPASGNWSLKLGCDQGSSVAFWQATMELSHRI